MLKQCLVPVTGGPLWGGGLRDPVTDSFSDKIPLKIYPLP